MARQTVNIELRASGASQVADEMGEVGKEVKPDEARLQADYDLTLREIVARLKAERKEADDA